MNPLRDEVKAELCPSLYSDYACDPANCEYLHLTDFQIPFSQVLKINDAYWQQSEAKSHNHVEPTLTPASMKLKAEQAPILCYVCYMPVHPEEDYYLGCCGCYCCKNCFENWHFKGHCPKCGATCDAPETIKGEVAEKVQEANKYLLKHEIVKK